jgi:hypothetical protein
MRLAFSATLSLTLATSLPLFDLTDRISSLGQNRNGDSSQQGNDEQFGFHG